MLKLPEENNLKAIYDELNRCYFNGAIAASIKWGRSRRGAKRSIRFGSYLPITREITINPILAEAPIFVLASTIYHEMLHQKYPSYIRNGRRVCHSKEFKIAERRYPFYQESKTWKKECLAKLSQLEARTSYSGLIVGQSVILNGKIYKISGFMERAYKFPVILERNGREYKAALSVAKKGVVNA